MLAIVVTLLSRGLTMGLPLYLWHLRLRLPVGSGRVLTWGGPCGESLIANRRLHESVPAASNRKAKETSCAFAPCS